MVPPPIPWLGHAIELASLALFAWCWLDLRRAGRGGHAELAVAAIYGCLLEILDMWIFGTYHYGPMTWLWAGHVPLYIPLLWATIIHSSMAMSDRSGLPERARPWLDGLLAVLIDLAIDGIAIRAGMWSWNIPLEAGWFGVPAGNLCAWMFVAGWYGWATRLIRRRIARGEPRWHRVFVPPVAYTGLFVSILTTGLLGELVGLRTHGLKMWMFWVWLAIFLAVVASASRRRGRPGDPVPISLTVNRWLMHGSFLLVLFIADIWRAVPWLAAVSLASLPVEWFAMRWTARKC